MSLLQEHRKKQKLRFKNNILLYISICWNTKSLFLNATKQKLISDMNGMPCKDGVLSIGTNKFSRSCTLVFCLTIRKNFITFLC